jgi:hypothetical protein
MFNALVGKKVPPLAGWLTAKFSASATRAWTTKKV